MLEYKVLSQRDDKKGNYDLEVVAAILNSHASEGWRLAESFVAATHWKSFNADMVMILERPVSEPT